MMTQPFLLDDVDGNDPDDVAFDFLLNEKRDNLLDEALLPDVAAEEGAAK